MNQQSEFGGRVAVVTGASRGLGHAVAAAFGSAGAHVVLTDIDPETLASGAKELEDRGIATSTYQLDVSNPDQVDDVFEAIDQKLGRVDVLVNNAGTVRRKLLVDHTVEDWRTQMAVNLDGTFFCAKAAVGLMRRSGSGVIVNVAAVAAFHYTVEHAAYAATKAGVVAFTRDLAYEVGPLGIRVNAVAPGFIRTPLLTKTLDEAKFSHIFRLGRWGEPEDIANAVIFLSSDASSFITGVTIPVAGGCDLRVTHEQ
jgi:3-oxoacyl-[acyl-carrier protein] reductase